jgi:predicted TIM-barrel fold metal-dependent hydrolase
MFKNCFRFWFLASALFFSGHFSAFGSPVLESVTAAKNIKIVDAHMHLTGEAGSVILERMDRNGVASGGAVGGLRPNGPKAMKEALGHRYIAALGQAEFQSVFMLKGVAGLSDLTDPSFVRLFEAAEKALADKTARGFGEIHVSNMKSGVRSGIQLNISFKTPVIQKMYEVANRYGGFIQVHAEGLENQQEIRRVALDYPQATTVLAHCLPYSNAGYIRQLLKEVPNLMCELSATGPVHGNRRVFSEDGPRADWLRLIEDFPDRFMLGTDPCCGLAQRYDEMILEFRVLLLPYLSSSTMKMVAYSNAKKFFDLED